MDKINQKNLNIALLFVIIVCFTIGIIANSSVLLIYFVGIIATLTTMKAINKNIDEFTDTITIFLSVFFFGFLLALMVNFDFVQEGTTFRYPDQMDFYEQAIFLASQNSISELIKAATISYPEYNVAYGLFGLLGYLDKVVTGNINFLPLLISVVYTTALIPVFLYHILKLYISQKLALKGSLYYGLFTPIMAYSGYLLRDMHMALLFMIILFWLVRRVTINRIFGIIAFLPIIANLRLANSLLVIIMLAVYIFTGKTSKFVRVLFLVVGFSFLVYFSGDFIDTINSTQSRIEMYGEFTRQQSEESDGIGKQINNLPPFIKETATIFIGLTSFPFWGKPPVNMNIYQFMMVFYSTITNIGWFFIVVGLLYFIRPIYSKIWNMKSKMFFYLLLLFIFYLILNVNNMNLRRIIYVFPFMYIPFLMVYQNVLKRSKKKYKQATIAFGLFLTFSYVVLLLR